MRHKRRYPVSATIVALVAAEESGCAVLCRTGSVAFDDVWSAGYVANVGSELARSERASPGMC